MPQRAVHSHTTFLRFLVLLPCTDTHCCRLPTLQPRRAYALRLRGARATWRRKEEASRALFCGTVCWVCSSYLSLLLMAPCDGGHRACRGGLRVQLQPMPHAPSGGKPPVLLGNSPPLEDWTNRHAHCPSSPCLLCEGGTRGGTHAPTHTARVCALCLYAPCSWSFRELRAGTRALHTRTGSAYLTTRRSPLYEQFCAKLVLTTFSIHTHAASSIMSDTFLLICNRTITLPSHVLYTIL